MEPVKFVPFCSFIDPGFWAELTERKLHRYKLDMSSKPLVGYYVNHDMPGVPCRLSLDFNAFELASAPRNAFPCFGDLILTNTIEQFKELDRKDQINNIGNSIWLSITSGEWLDRPQTLCKFLFTCFANLKKYTYHYWFASPAFCYPDDIIIANRTPLEGNSAIFQLCAEYLRLNGQEPAFLLQQDQIDKPMAHKLTKLKDSDFDCSKIILVVCDPSTFQEHPGWPLRNFIAAIAYQRPELCSLKILCLRQRHVKGELDMSHSLFLNISFTRNQTTQIQCPKVVGWEKDNSGLLRPRFVDMSQSMDPRKQADGAVDLNLSLMRWRLVPELRLEKMKNLKCLLFGAGTLGCNVARCLLGWGVRHITLLDNSRVSMSNPVRQSLYKFNDALDGGRFKAEVAADGLKEIFPSVAVKGLVATVPMPGHFVTDTEISEVGQTVADLDQLVSSHDVVFLLMDSREGRWLPTLLSAVHSKIAFSVALGFDSYVIIRHGVRLQTDIATGSSGIDCSIGAVITGDQLGCYFCNDVTAPGNSIHDRSLDQQCTVTRPGLSMIAAGLAVEVLSCLIQHPDQGLAPADCSSTEDESSNQSCLGSVPHQLRGYLSRFSQMSFAVRRFNACTACSDIVIEKYNSDGFDFLYKVFNDPSILEEITGLKELEKGVEDNILEFGDSESISSMDSKS